MIKTAVYFSANHDKHLFTFWFLVPTEQRRHRSRNLDQSIVLRVCIRQYDPSAGTDPGGQSVKEGANAKTTTTGTAPKKHPLESTRRHTNNNIDEDTRERGASNQPTPERGQSNKDDPPPATTVSIPNGRNTTKRTRGLNMGRDLITIYESKDETKLEGDPADADAWTLR